MVDKTLFQRYEVALLACTDLGRMQVEALVRSVKGLPPQQQAARLMAEYPKIIANYGQAAAQATMQWYQDARDAHFADDEEAEDYEAEAAMQVQQSWAYEDVQKAATSGLSRLPGMAVNRIMHRADQTMAHNVQNDPAHPCWAVVPSYGACGFCVMVGSNGFYMKRQPVKVQRHDHCRCTVVADWDTKSPKLEGYDPDALYRAYHEAEESTRAYVDYRWSRMTDEEKARYRRKGRSAKDVFKTQVISKEIKRRDPMWVQTGKGARANYSEKPRDSYGVRKSGASDYGKGSFVWRGNEWKDLFAHDALESAGFFVRSRLTIQQGGDENIDVDLNERLCEIKSPEAKRRPDANDELKFVQRNVQSARHQFEKSRNDGSMRMVLNNYYTEFFDEDEDRVYERFVREVEGQGFTDAWFIKKDGTVLVAK